MAVDREALARALREARENLGMSQEAVAKRVGLSRTVLAQIELGNRRVSCKELERFATLYKTSLAHLTGTARTDTDDVEFTISQLAPDLFADEMTKQGVSSVLLLVKLASSLERKLGRKPRRVPHYDAPAPSSTAEAIAQGEDAAAEERRRLGLFQEPVANAVGLVASQGIRVAVAPLQEGLTCLFLRVQQIGTFTVVNSDCDDVQRRFVLLSAYAHVLFERGAILRAARPSSAGELVARRATAFANAFLLPEAGVREMLVMLGKGQPSRKGFVVLDPATDEWTRAEQRTAPGSQTVTYADASAIAGRFGVSYKAVIFRLLSLGLISEAESRSLLSTKAQQAAEQLLAFTRPRTDSGVLPEDRFGLKAEVLYLAIECYRRGLIKRDSLGSIAEMLQLPDLPEAKLLELAEAAR